MSFSKDFKDAPPRPLDVSHDGALPPAETPEPAGEPADDMFDIDTLTPDLTRAPFPIARQRRR